jgi:hypothetical protein
VTEGGQTPSENIHRGIYKGRALSLSIKRENGKSLSLYIARQYAEGIVSLRNIYKVVYLGAEISTNYESFG